MGDERNEKVQQRAYAIWEREGGGDQERHWHTAKDELAREAELPEAGEIASTDVLTVEALAMRTGITGQQAQDLIDQLGTDRAAIEDAARSLETQKLNFSK